MYMLTYLHRVCNHKHTLPYMCTHTHTTVLCTLTPLHRSYFIATLEIKFHWQMRAAEEGEKKDREREKTEERQKERDRGYRSVGVGSISD